MIQRFTKPMKVALCRKCNGRGRVVVSDSSEGSEYFDTCPQCEGSGRVMVSVEITMDIRPYRANE